MLKAMLGLAALSLVHTAASAQPAAAAAAGHAHGLAARRAGHRLDRRARARGGPPARRAKVPTSSCTAATRSAARRWSTRSPQAARARRASTRPTSRRSPRFAASPDDIARDYTRLDLLVNNAGLFLRDQRQVSTDGHELTFAVNYLAGYLLTYRLLPLLEKGTSPRIVNVSSLECGAHRLHRRDARARLPGYRAYSQSKLAQVMFTVDLAAGAEAQGHRRAGGAPGHRHGHQHDCVGRR